MKFTYFKKISVYIDVSTNKDYEKSAYDAFLSSLSKLWDIYSVKFSIKLKNYLYFNFQTNINT